MDVNQRIRQLMDERGWTEYRLAKNAGLSQSTIINIFHRNTVPGISTLSSICDAFGIGLSEFFREDSVADGQCELISLWNAMDNDQKDTILRVMRYIKPSC